MGGGVDFALINMLIGVSINKAYSDVLSGSHLKTHEVLEDNADLAVQVFDRIVPKVNAVEAGFGLR